MNKSSAKLCYLHFCDALTLVEKLVPMHLSGCAQIPVHLKSFVPSSLPVTSMGTEASTHAVFDRAGYCPLHDFVSRTLHSSGFLPSSSTSPRS